MHSAWIGEHHFSTLGVLSCPELVLAYVAARTERIRLAPAVTVLPLHHPIRVAEQWATLDLLSGGRVDFAAGRGYDRREYGPFGVDLRGQPGDLRGRHGDRPRAVGSRRADLASRRALPVRRCARSRRGRCSGRSRPMSPRFRSRRSSSPARLGCGLDRRAVRRGDDFGGLRQVADLYRETCAAHGKPPGRLMCSYFIHFADTPAEERAARARQIRYYKECVIAGLPGRPDDRAAELSLFHRYRRAATNVRPEDLSENSVLLGTPAQIIDTLKKVEAAGFDEVILYFNVGLKPHAQVKDEMARFMAEVAPEFGKVARLAGHSPSRRRDASCPGYRVLIK